MTLITSHPSYDIRISIGHIIIQKILDREFSNRVTDHNEKRSLGFALNSKVIEQHFEEQTQRRR